MPYALDVVTCLGNVTYRFERERGADSERADTTRTYKERKKGGKGKKQEENEGAKGRERDLRERGGGGHRDEGSVW
eukprot:878240-Rhodomonas_salina.3